MLRTERIITDDELHRDYSCYSDLRQHSDHPIIIDEHGIIRWKQNGAVRWVVDNGVDLNALSIAHQRGFIPTEDYMAFYRQMGYSLSGYLDIFAEAIDQASGEDGE
jgi:hypothetical protein